jgi:periplasmic protein TonB
MTADAPDTWLDPIADVARSMRRDRSWMGAAVLVAITCHATLALTFPRLAARHAVEVLPTEVVDIDLPKPPAPPPPQTPPEAPKTPKADPPTKVAPAKDEATPPQPAQAAAVLTRREDPNEPVDLTNTFVTGTAAVYAGGSTTSWGTNLNAVRGVTAPVGMPARAPTPSSVPAMPRPDQSRPPALAGGREWSCPFPSEADTEEIDSAIVVIKISVNASGTVEDVAVVKDPGHGFGREARQCALSKSWTAALDRDGRPIDASTVLRVRFDR